MSLFGTQKIFTKKPGETMDQLVERIKKINPCKIAYTTRLDPMAKGLCNFLIGNECSHIKKHLESIKTYQVKIILGIKTDTDDPLGIINSSKFISASEVKLIQNQIVAYIESIKCSNFKQKYHYYSTKMLNHRRRKTQKPNDINDSHTVSINNFSLINSGIYDYIHWKNKLIKTIENIDPRKDFRQKEIITQWEKLSESIEHLYWIKLELTVSSGFFIRQLVSDISTEIKIPLMAFNINRIGITS